MKGLITNTSTLIISLIGFIGGSIWAVQSGWEIEPIIIASVSAIQILTYMTLKFMPSNSQPSDEKQSQNIMNKEKVKKQVNIQNNSGKIDM